MFTQRKLGSEGRGCLEGEYSRQREELVRGSEAGACLVYQRNSKETSVAGMDCVRGKVVGDNVMAEPCRLLHRNIGFL